MFKTVNPYDEAIAKATDETSTSEDWDKFLTVWDKVNEDGETGARNCVSALQKRLQHRSGNVQLFSLTLADALVLNCGPALHREICGKAFTQTLVKLVNDRTTHDNVKKRVLKYIAKWVGEHNKNPDFELMVETYEALKSQNHKFEDEAAPERTGPSDDVLRREEEDLQRVLAESAALAQSDPLKGFAKSHSAGKELPQQPSPVISVKALYNFDTRDPGELAFKAGEVVRVLAKTHDDWWTGELGGRQGIFPKTYVEEIPESAQAPPPSHGGPSHASHSGYGQPQPNQYQQSHQQQHPQQHRQSYGAPSPAPMTDDEMEAQLFSQVGSIDKLLSMMRNMDPQRDGNPAQNEELLDLYQQSMDLRPKVTKLIEKYNRKQAELGALNEKFSRAASTYDRMVQGSQGHHGGSYQNGYAQQPQQPQQPPQQHYAQGYSSPAPGAAASSQQQPGSSLAPSAQRADDATLAALSPQQRQQYEQQWAEYEQQLASYHEQQRYFAQHGQPPPHVLAQMAQQGQQPFNAGPPPPANSSGPPPPQQQQQAPPHPHQQHAPAPAGVPEHGGPSAYTAPVAPTDASAPQPYWDEQRGVWLRPGQIDATAGSKSPAPPQHQQGPPLAHDPRQGAPVPQSAAQSHQPQQYGQYQQNAYSVGAAQGPAPPHQSASPPPHQQQPGQVQHPSEVAYGQSPYGIADQLQSMSIHPPAPSQSPPHAYVQQQQQQQHPTQPFPTVRSPHAASPASLPPQDPAAAAWAAYGAPPPQTYAHSGDPYQVAGTYAASAQPLPTGSQGH